MIPLDIFRKSHHNRSISDKPEAWLTFLSMDDPESIVRLISTYPEFTEPYEDIYTLCLNIKRMMGMYSKELLELDLGTIDYMIDEMQNTIDAQKEQIDSQQQINLQKDQLDSQQQQTDSQKQQLDSQRQQLQELASRIHELKAQVEEFLSRK